MSDGDDERLFGGYTGRMLWLVTGGSLVGSMVGLVLPPLLPTIIEELSISASAAGALMTVWWLTVAAHNLPGGRLADGLSHKTVLVGGLALSTAGIALLSGADTYPLLLAGVAVAGAGRGLFQPAGIAQISALFARRRAQALGIRGAAFQFGGVAAGGLVVAVLAVATWRATFLPIAAALAVAIALMHAWSREPYAIERVSLGVRETGTRLLRSERIRWIVVALSLYGFVWNGATSFLPAYLQAVEGFDPATASAAFAALFLAGGVTQPLVGAIGDRTGRLRAAIASTLLCAAGLAGVLLAPTAAAVWAGVLAFGVGLATFWPVTVAYGIDLVPEDSRAGDWGAVTATFLTVESLGSGYVGVVVERAGYGVAFGSLLACLLATLIALGLAVRTGRRAGARSGSRGGP